MSINVRSDSVVVVCGKRSSGKSRFFKTLLKPFKRRIIWDYNWEHADMGYVTHYLNQINEAIAKGLWHIVYQPFNKEESDYEAFLKVCNRLRNYVLAIEEIERYNYAKTITPTTRKLIDVGRHKGIGIFATCRRINRVHQDIPANADHIFIFKQHKPQDLDLLREWVGEEIYRLKELPKYYFIHYDDSEGSTVVREPV